MDSAEAADYLAVSIHTIRAWTKFRNIPSIKLNGVVRFDRNQLDEWIEKNSKEDINESRAIEKWASLRKKSAMAK